MRISVLYLAICLPFIGFSQQSATAKEVFTSMAGSYNSCKQAATDTNYYNIALHMEPIWQNRTDGYWLYVEQAMATMIDKPYRQRIYHVYQEADKVVSKVYEINNAKNYIGGWRNTAILKPITTDSLIDRQGCTIFLTKNKDGNFAGSTPGKECLSSLRGASYATSEVIIKKDELISWDRGWDKNDKQVWGAEKGGYVFVKEFSSK